MDNKKRMLATPFAEFNIKQSLLRALFILPLLLSVTACDDLSDRDPPIIILNGADEITLEYNTQYNELAVAAVDNVDGPLSVEISGSVDPLTLGTYIITYTATDDSGNTATRTRQVTVVDTTAPTITFVGSDTLNIFHNYNYTDLDATATAYDEYDGEVIVTQTNDVDNTVIGSYTITYLVIDSQGNEASVIRNVNVVEPIAFITTWKTTEANEEVIVPTKGSDYNYSVDWGDSSAVDETQTGDATHVYVDAGTYTVSITGIFPQMYFPSSLSTNYNKQNSERLISVEQWGNTQWRSMANAFYGTTNLTINATDIPVLIYVEDMSHMFENAAAFNQPLDDWDVSNVTDMSSMFMGATAFNQPFYDWDVSNVTDMSSMFMGATAFNEQLTHWDVSNVTDMSSMFMGATAFNEQLTHWDVSNVSDMSFMLNYSGLSTNNYDALLNAWSLQVLQPDVTFGADGIHYSSDREAARQSIIDTYGWTINDAGLLD